MAFRTSALALLALASAVSAQTPGFDAITTPLTNEQVPACANYVINWDYTSTYPSTVSIQLLEGATPSTLQLGPVLASGVDNSLGQYTWAVDCSLGADATYGIKITYDADSTGATFQYSNPFQIVAAAASSSSSTQSSTATSTTSTGLTTTTAPTTTATTTATTTTAPGKQDIGSSETDTVYSTQYVTITSCAATVTDCPARSTVVSSFVSAVTSSAGAVGASGSTGSTGSFSTVTPVVSSASSAVTGKPYPVGNGTTPNGGSSPNGLGTVTLPAKSSSTGSASASATTAPVTAGAAKVATGSFVAVAGLAAAMFAL